MKIYRAGIRQNVRIIECTQSATKKRILSEQKILNLQSCSKEVKDFGILSIGMQCDLMSFDSRTVRILTCRTTPRMSFSQSWLMVAVGLYMYIIIIHGSNHCITLRLLHTDSSP